jgi:hypothetical protein
MDDIAVPAAIMEEEKVNNNKDTNYNKQQL